MASPPPPPVAGCITTYFYYCSNADEVLDVAARRGHDAAMHFWLDQMEFNLNTEPHGGVFADVSHLVSAGPELAEPNATKLTLRSAVRARAAAIAAFSRRAGLFPHHTVPPSTPVLYPFSGMDVLTAMHFFPNASSYTLLANLQLGLRHRDPLTCFSNRYCVQMASRSTYKVAQNWNYHHLAWLQTSRMMHIFVPDVVGSTLWALIFFMHVGGRTVDTIASGELNVTTGTSTNDQTASASIGSGLLHNTSAASTTVGSSTKGGRNASKHIRLPAAPPPPPPPPRWIEVRAGSVRCTFFSTTISDDPPALDALLRHAATPADTRRNHPRATTEPADRPPLRRYATILKAAPDELTSQRWLYDWLLPRSVALLQDETGVPLDALDNSSTSAPLVARGDDGDGSPNGSHGHGSRSEDLKDLVHVGAERAAGPRAYGGHSRNARAPSWIVATHGSYDRMQIARRFWAIPFIEMRPWSYNSTSMLRLAYPPTNHELPFPFGYGAYPSECRAAAAKLKQPLPEGDVEPCHGILLAAWRDADGRWLARPRAQGGEVGPWRVLSSTALHNGVFANVSGEL